MSLLLSKAPSLLMPVPLSVRAPVLVIVWPFRSSAASAVTETAPLPRAVALPDLSNPSSMLVSPL